MPIPARSVSFLRMLRRRQMTSGGVRCAIIALLGGACALSAGGCATAVSDRPETTSPLTVKTAPGTPIVFAPLIVSYERAGRDPDPVDPLPNEAQIREQVVRRI